MLFVRKCAQLGRSSDAILQAQTKGKLTVGWEEGWMDTWDWNWVRVGFWVGIGFSVCF